MARNRGGGTEKARREGAREKLRVESSRTLRGRAVAEAAQVERRLADAPGRRRSPPRAASAPTPPGRDLRRFVLALGFACVCLAVALGLVVGGPSWLIPLPVIVGVAVGQTMYLLRVRLASAAERRAARVRVAERAEPSGEQRARVADEPVAPTTTCVECGEPVREGVDGAPVACALCIDPVHAGACEERHAARHAGAGATREGAYR